MGWTYYNTPPRDALAECDSLCTWDNHGSRSRVLASGISGRAYYAAVETVKADDGARSVWCAVILLDRSGGGFGYKDMSEDMGPNEDRAPLHVLRALEPLPPPEWRHCETCDGTGTLSGSNWAEHAQGKPCHVCYGAGRIERKHWARDWRRRAWAHHGGEPQGVQLALI